MNKKFNYVFLLLCMIYVVTPVIITHAKDLPVDGNIPLTSEYFSDEWFLKTKAEPYDKNKDGYLSSRELAKVTKLVCTEDLSDFSQVQYFTGLKELILERKESTDDDDDYDSHGIGVGSNVLDLTVFPYLEKAVIGVDSGKSASGLTAIKINASGLNRLKDLIVFGEVSGEACNYDGSNAEIGKVDLHDTPALETLWLTDVKTVVLDDRSPVKEIGLTNVRGIPLNQIIALEKLESLYIHANMPDFWRVDLSKSISLTNFKFISDTLEEIILEKADTIESVCIKSRTLRRVDVSTSGNLRELLLECPILGAVTTSGADALEKIEIKSGLLSEINVSQNKRLKELLLECPALDAVTLAGADALEWTCIDESALKAIDISKNQSLKEISLTSSELGTFDVSKNLVLESLAVDSDRLKTIDLTKNIELKRLDISSDTMKKLDLKKNRNLEFLGVHCDNMRVPDLSANTELTGLSVDATPLKNLNLKRQKKLAEFQMKNNNKPPKLDLSANVNLKEVSIENTSYREISLPELKKLRRLFLKGNQKLEKVNLKYNRRLVWLIINRSKKLTKLNLTNNTKLDEINVSDNALKTLKIGKQKNMRFLYCQNNKLEALDLTDVEGGLYEVWCDKGVKVKGYKGEIRRF